MTTSMYRTQRGLTLIELMIAVVLALVVTAAVVAVMISSKKAYVTQDKLARVQENGRFAMHYLMQDIRMAKYMGCLKEVVDVVRNNLNTTATNFYYGSAVGSSAEGVELRIRSTDPLGRPLEGIDTVGTASTWSPSGSALLLLPTAFKPSAVAAGYSTDMITIRRANPSALAQVVAPMGSETAAVRVDTVEPFQTNQVVLIANCEKGDVFQVSSIDTTNRTLAHATTGNADFIPGNRTASLSDYYGKNGDSAQILQIVTRTFYVADNPAGVPSLFVQENGNTPIELVEGIESLQVLYGVHDGITKQPVRYLRAGDAALDWTRVVSIRIGILARSASEAYGDTSTLTYDVLGTTLGPFNDRNERRVFEATISLKSMVL